MTPEEIEQGRKKPPYEFLPPPYEGETTHSYHDRIARVVNERLSDLYHAVNVALNRGDFVGHPVGEPFPRETAADVTFCLEGPCAGEWVASIDGATISRHEVFNQVELAEFERRARIEIEKQTP
jgi:hypothetical protein